MINFEGVGVKRKDGEDNSENQEAVLNDAKLGLSNVAKEHGESLLSHVEYLRKGKEDDFENRNNSVETYKAKVEELKNNIEESKKSFIKRIINFRKINEKSRGIERTEEIISQVQDEQIRRQELISFYDQIIADQIEIEDLMGEALIENAEFDEGKRIELLKMKKIEV